MCMCVGGWVDGGGGGGGGIGMSGGDLRPPSTVICKSYQGSVPSVLRCS